MKNFSPEMRAALADPSLPMHVCWRITRTDGVVKRFTDADRPVYVEGFEYTPNGSTERTAIAYTAGLASDNLDVRGILDSDTITEADLMAGKYDYAEVEIMLVFTSRPDLRAVTMMSGLLGEVETDRGTYSVRMNSMNHMFNHTIGEQTTPICRAVLGDARCKVNMVPWTQEVVITEIVSNRRFKAASIANPTALSYGTLTMVNGPAAGLSMEIRAASATEVEIFLPMRVLPAVGNTMRLKAGCDNTRATCKNVYNNLINNRSEPDLPGQDELIAPTIG